MVSHSDEGNRFANVPKDWMDELSSQHRDADPGSPALLAPSMRGSLLGYGVAFVGDLISLMDLHRDNDEATYSQSCG